MRRIVLSILAIVTGSCAFCIQARSAEITAILQAGQKKRVDFFKLLNQSVVVGVVPSTSSEVPIGIAEVLVKPPGEGLSAVARGPDIVFQSYSKVAGTFVVKVNYKVEVRVLQRIGRSQMWVRAPGGPQLRALEIQVGVSLPPLDAVVVEEGKQIRVSLPRPAINPQPTPGSSGFANVTADGDAIVIRGKKSGALSWDISYQVERFRFKDPLAIEVVKSREDLKEDLEVKGDTVVLPSSRRPKYKCLRLIAEENPEICKAEKEEKGLRLTGLKEGSAKVTAVALDAAGQRVVVDISVTVTGGKDTAPKRDPEPAPRAPEPTPPKPKRPASASEPASPAPTNPKPAPTDPAPSSPAPKPAREQMRPPKLRLDSYLERIGRIAEKEGTFGGLRMKVRVVPDAYRFLMAKGMVEIEPLKLDESQRMARLKGIYASSKGMKNQMLIQVTLSLVDREAFLIFTKSPTSSFAVEQGAPLMFSLSPDYS